MSNQEDASNRTITMERTFSAPIALVWEAWTQPEHIAAWWGPPGMQTKIIEHNFSVGGKWKYTMEMPDGNQFIADGVYTQIVELQRIFSSANFKPMTEGVEIQAIFAEADGKTSFTFNVIHPTEAYCKQQEQMGILNGWGSVFTRLEEHLQTIH